MKNKIWNITAILFMTFLFFATLETIFVPAKTASADNREESETLPPPQLSIASWIAAGLCTTAMYNLATGKPVNYFPKFYFSSFLQ